MLSCIETRSFAIKTIWGESLQPDSVLQEYPRPQMERDSYCNLNGLWDFCVTNGEEPTSFSEKILVPFSPECELSGNVQIPQANQSLWYRRNVILSKNFNRGRILLHFGAVDWHTQVFVNGTKVGEHYGAYTAFSFDITDYLRENENELLVHVIDPSDTGTQPRGKQKTKRGHIWYTAQSGIWQTVWLESVPQTYIQALEIVPNRELESVQITVVANEQTACAIQFEQNTYKGTTNEPITIQIENHIAWSPENPHLYYFTAECKKDSVKSYFAMRSLTIQEDKDGIKRLFLNGRAYFCNGVLDQGYWSDGLYTAPSDEALQFDIIKMKELGFNTIRKHVKVEPMRWYYHCDKIGMLVWQEMANGGQKYNFFKIHAPLFVSLSVKDSNYAYFGRKDAAGRQYFIDEYTSMVRQLKSSPCVVVWVLFNNGWGQFDSKKMYTLSKELDPTRLVDHASGYYDQGIGDFKSVHRYFRSYQFKKDTKNRPVVLSGFGGYSYKEQNNDDEIIFSYKKLQARVDYIVALRSLFLDSILIAKDYGLCASIYTQVSDIEEEQNGLLSFDRKRCKIAPSELEDIMNLLNG